MRASRTGVDLTAGTYDEASATQRFEFDHDQTTPSMAAVAALSAVSDEDPTAMEPIQQRVDSDALDEIAAGPSKGAGDVHVTWRQSGYTITVHSDGVVAVGPGSLGSPWDYDEAGRR